MIVTKQESMASLIHDTSHKVIIRACIMDSDIYQKVLPYFLI